MSTKLTENFSLEEMAITTHRSWQDTNLKEARLKAEVLTKVCMDLLEPIRKHFGKPVVVHSGFRCRGLNKDIGGSKTSQHLKGEAVDFHVVGVSHEDVFEWVWKKSNIPFGQLILEGVVEGHPSWIHLSLGKGYREDSRCGEVMEWNAREGYVVIAKV